MAKRKPAVKRRSRKRSVAAETDTSQGSSHPRYCAVPEMPQRVFAPGVDSLRASLIRVMADKWANGTVLHYYFFDRQTDGEYVYYNDGTREWQTWTAGKSQKDAVRKGFKVWEDLGIGIVFEEVDDRDQAEIRVGFMQGDGSWSYIGRYVLEIGANKRTMNIGWDIRNDIDTAVHEVGHTLGFPHEHQNPNSGIVWDEEAVYRALAGPPNSWPRHKTFHNILRKIPTDSVQGSNWDPNSIMHYPFGPGLIKEPAQYTSGLQPAPGLSERDETWVRTFYPPLEPAKDPELKLLDPVSLDLGEGQQKNLVIEPTATRYYIIRTFGRSDTVMVLFEDVNGDLRYLTADDDSGQDYNANLRVKLFRRHRYVLRIRLYWDDATGETAVMMW